MRTLWVATVAGLVAWVGFASTANASATIDLIWAGSGTTNTTLATSSSAVLNVILTNDANNIGGSISVDYSGVLGELSVVNIANNPNAGLNLLPLTLGPTSDVGGGLIESFNAAALPPYVGAGLPGGQSYLLGTITFHKSGPGAGGNIAVVLGINDSVAAGTGAGTLPASQVGLGVATLTSVPEPGTLTMLALGLGGIALAGRRR